MWFWKLDLESWYDCLPLNSYFCVLLMGLVHPPFKLPGEPGNINYDYPEGFNITNATEAASASSASSSQASATLTSSATVSASSTSTEYLRTTPTPGVRNVNHPPYVINRKYFATAMYDVRNS